MSSSQAGDNIRNGECDEFDKDLESEDSEKEESIAEGSIADAPPPSASGSDKDIGGKKKGGRPAKVVAGKKQCKDCIKLKLVADFGLQKPSCFTCCRAIDNTRTAAELQGEMEWFNEQLTTPQKKMKLIDGYNRKVGAAACTKKRKGLGSFNVAQYKQQIKNEEALLRDGVYEMMHECAFEVHARKPKHFPPMGLDSVSAQREFQQLAEKADALVDYLGPNERYKLRVGILVKTLVTFRNASTTSQEMVLDDAAKKAPSQYDLNNMYKRVHENMEKVGGVVPTSLSRTEMAKVMASSSFARGGTFDGDQASIGAVTGLVAETPHSAEDVPENESLMNNADGSPAKRKTADDDPKQPGKRLKAWPNRDEKVADAMKKQIGMVDTLADQVFPRDCSSGMRLVVSLLPYRVRSITM